MSFTPRTAMKLAPWREHSLRVAETSSALQTAVASQTVVSSQTAVVWHLISGNNRALARGALIHDTLDAALISAQTLRIGRSQLEVTVVSDPTRNVYGWSASEGGVTVLTCARWYASERDNRQSVELALRSIHCADLQRFARPVADHIRARHALPPP